LPCEVDVEHPRVYGPAPTFEGLMGEHDDLVES
jgi:hypothetical protein